MDLPLPVGPTSATVSPGATSKLTSWSAGARPGYAKVRCEKRRLGAAAIGFVVAGPVRPALTEGGLIEMRPGSDTPALSVSDASPAPSVAGAGRDAPIISSSRVIDVRPRRTIESVQPSAIVGHVR